MNTLQKTDCLTALSGLISHHKEVANKTSRDISSYLIDNHPTNTRMHVYRAIAGRYTARDGRFIQ